MTRSLSVLAALGFVLALGGSSRAGDSGCEQCHPWGYHWHKHKDNKNPLRQEEKRLNRFWHDYYDSLGRYYGNMSRIDWLTYYKNHGQQIPNANPCAVQYQPVFFAPMAQPALPPGPPSGQPMYTGYSY